MSRFKLGDRLAVTNRAGLRVVGTYTRLWDGTFGYVTLRDGTDWQFAWDAKIEKTEEEPTDCPVDLSECEDDAREEIGRIFRCEDIEEVRPYRYHAPKVDLIRNPELRPQYRKETEYRILDGEPDRKIARELGVSRSYVYNVRHGMEEDDD